MIPDHPRCIWVIPGHFENFLIFIKFHDVHILLVTCSLLPPEESVSHPLSSTRGMPQVSKAKGPPECISGDPLSQIIMYQKLILEINASLNYDNFDSVSDKDHTAAWFQA